MRTRHLLFSLAGLGLGLVVTGACTNGSGGDIPTPPKNPGNPGNEPPSAGSLPTGGGGQEPTGGSGYESPGGGSEPTGGQEPPGGGTDPLGDTGCLPCATYTCSISLSGGSNGSSSVVTGLSSLSDGSGCVVPGAGLEILCGGNVVAEEDAGIPLVLGSWTANGSGFSANASFGVGGGQVETVSITCGTITFDAG